MRNPMEVQISNVMEQNRRCHDGFSYTLPSPELYPFQWFWDSCFHAIILARLGEMRAAKAEIESVLAKPLANGLIPHIIYWEKPKARTHWGREARGDVINKAWGVEHTSSITQPPLIAKVLYQISMSDRDIDFMAAYYQVLHRYFSYLKKDRRLNGDTLVYIINPDESGEDNSPRFDTALGLPHTHSMQTHLDARVALMEAYSSCNFEAQTCMNAHFGVADVSFNIVYMEALFYMAAIAETLEHTTDALMYRTEARRVGHDIRTFLKQGSLFLSYDFVHRRFIQTKTWTLFMPLYGGLLSKEEATRLVADHLLNPNTFNTPYLIPSTACTEAAFDPAAGFWRGPIWMAPNWFIYHGLRRYGYTALAEQVRTHSHTLITHGGLREHYNPLTGEGFGAHDFTWGGLILDMV